MRILSRYISSQFLRIFGICVLGVPFLFIVIDLTDNLDIYLSDQDATLGEVLLHYVYQFPYQSLLAFPIAALLASVFTVSTMTRHSETTAAKAGGISFFRLTRPILLLSILLSGLALVLTDVVPSTNRRAEDVLGQQESRSRTLRMSFVYRGNEGRVYKVGRLDTREASISDIQIEREGAGPAYPTYNVSAPTARFDSTGAGWIMENGWLRRFPEPGRSLEMKFSEMRQRAFTETPEELLAQPKDEDQMRYSELTRFVDAIERSGGKADRLRVARAMRIAFPFAVFIIVLFGTPLAHSNSRGGAPASIGIALATTILFLILQRISEALGSSGGLPAVLAAWIPNIIFLAAGLVLTAKVRT